MYDRTVCRRAWGQSSPGATHPAPPPRHARVFCVPEQCPAHFGAAKKIARGPVYNNIDLAVMLSGFGNGVYNRGIISNVRGNGQTFAAILLNELLHRDQVFLIPARDREPRPMLGHRPGDAGRDPGAAAGYKRNLTL